MKDIKRGQNNEKIIHKISLGEISREGENPCYFLLRSKERGSNGRPGVWFLMLRTGD